MATETAENKTKQPGFEQLLGELSAEESKKWPEFGIGDTIKVHYKIIEGDKQRIQLYEGTVISMRGAGMSKTFVVRRISHEVGVERIFPYHSPSIAKLEVTRKGKVRRAKLFYLRGKSGKAGRIKESREAQAKIIAEQKAEREAAQGDKKKRRGRKRKAAEGESPASVKETAKDTAAEPQVQAESAAAAASEQKEQA